jgi:phosphotransferase system  glucose/maltose/N-acetylglucosamine-specific IIC component
MINKNDSSWYNKSYIVVLTLIFIFPVGIYALWKNNNASKFLKIIVSFIIFSSLISVIISNPETNVTPLLDINKEKKSRLFDMVYQSELKIKENLKDPSSFELIEKEYNFLNDSIYKISIKYSGTNSFNARIKNTYIKTGVLIYNPKDTSFTNVIKFETN